jgi:hypothetical protein
MAVTPPLDRITKLPAQSVDIIQQQFNLLLDDTLKKMKTVIQEVAKLPAGLDCDDPRVKKAKETLQAVQDNLQKVQENLPKIQQIISQVSTIIKTGIAVKNAIAVAQLSNPITAPLFIAQISQEIQNELIVNALEAIQPLQAVPQQALGKLQTLVPPLQQAIAKLVTSCNGEDLNIDFPVARNGGDDFSNQFPAGFDYNSLLPSEFYRNVNVSNVDLDQRSDAIQQLIEQQQNLLTSLLESPSQVYKQNGPPPNDLGKAGDFYIDTQNNVPYGPKPSDTIWGSPLN